MARIIRWNGVDIPAHADMHATAGPDPVAAGGGGTGGYTTVQAAGTALTQRATLDFAGNTLAETDDATNLRTIVTAPDYGVVGDVVTQAYSDAPAAGVSARVARADHRHGMPAAGGGPAVVTFVSVAKWLTD